MGANFVNDLGDKAQVPIISFSTTSPSLTSLRSSYEFRVAQNDSSQLRAISAIIQAFGWSELVPIYVDNEFGEGVIPYVTNALQEINARIPYWCVIPPTATGDQIAEKLQQLMTLQTRVFIVHMLPSLGTRLFAKAKEIGMMDEGTSYSSPLSLVTTDPNNIGTSYSSPLSLDGLWGLFLIVGASSALAVLIHAALFFYQNWHFLIRSEPELSLWRKICLVFQIFDQREFPSPNNVQAVSANDSATNIMIATSPIPSARLGNTDSYITNIETHETPSSSTMNGDLESIPCSPSSSSSHSSHTASQVIVLEIQETSSTMHGD